MREMVQLAAGLDEERRLSREARERALACLERFAQRLRQIPPAQVRVVGTNTLRQARNSQSFIGKAEAILGYPIEIISGMEEARLIYLGVVHSTGSIDGKRLVVDIGGGSTELIIGEGFKPLRLESLYMGCISMSRRFFSSGRIRDSDLQAAEMLARLELQPLQTAYRKLGWDISTGASGTVKAIRDVIAREGWIRDGGISREALDRLRNVLRESAGETALIERWDLRPERAKVFAGGFTVLYGIFQALDIAYMQVADGALREGVIYDMLGRIRQEDVRERTIAMLSRRYAIDGAQARRVVNTVRQLFEQVRSSWELEDERFAHDLEWAAWLHELGLTIAHSQYHKHGAYILEYSDLPGFSRSEQLLLAALVRGHRRKFPLAVFEKLPRKLMLPAERLCILLRLAVLLHRGHRRQELPEAVLKVKKHVLELTFPDGWLDENPLTRVDLETEAQYLKKADYRLLFR
jgi:exopolyphosphatase/guanosine-5'-triphosphate,3'-diphosphate pyrophosphatase